jgi:hypothetical protein
VQSSIDTRLQRGERLRRSQAVGRAHGEPGGLLAHQARDPDHEELVQVRREDGAELDALEQRLRLLGGEVEDARIELDPRELAVQKA